MEITLDLSTSLDKFVNGKEALGYIPNEEYKYFLSKNIKTEVNYYILAITPTSFKI